MGAGNPLLRSFDEEKYSPITYFFDFSQDIEEWKKGYEEANERTISDQHAYELMGEEEFENFLCLFQNFCASHAQFNYVYSRKNSIYISELSAGYREDGVVLCESDNSLIITSTDGENHHMPVSIIPNCKWDDLRADSYYDNVHKEGWYAKRKLDFDNYLDMQADKRHEKILRKMKQEEKLFWIFVSLNYSAQFINENLSERNGPWLSSSMGGDKLLKRFNITDYDVKRYLKGTLFRRTSTIHQQGPNPN